MATKTISEINEYEGTSINPLDTPDELFELYSVPSYDNQYPEIIKGSAIGSTKITVQENDVLICKINPRINRVWIVKHNTSHRLLASSEWIVVRNSSINPRYLQWYFSSPAFRDKITSQVAGIGGSLTRAQPKVVANYSVPIPSIQKQTDVANSMDQIEHLISLRKKQLQKLDDLVKARFVEMFGDCRTNPYDWETKALGEIAEVGSSKRVFVEELQESGIPFYRGTEIGALAEGKTIQPELFITPAHYEELIAATGKPQPGDLLMPSICPDGRIWVVDTEEPFYFKDGRVLWVHSIKPEYDPVFLLHTLKDRIMTDYDSIASGTTFAELKIFALKQCQVFDVPIEKQKEFVAFISQVDKSKMSIQQGLEKLETLKKSLMQQYFG